MRLLAPDTSPSAPSPWQGAPLHLSCRPLLPTTSHSAHHRQKSSVAQSSLALQGQLDKLPVPSLKVEWQQE